MKKTLITGLAAISVVGMIGGGTLAAWNDFSETPANVGAGILKLNVSSTGGAGSAESFGFGNLAPGENRVQEIFIASSDADSVPNATLYFELTDLSDTEGNGPGGPAGVPINCTTNSESAAESGDCGSTGEFSSEAVMTVKKAAANVSGGCSGVAYTGDAARVYPTFANAGNTLAVNTLAAHVAAGQKEVDNDVAPGEGVCIQINIGMPLLENGGTTADGTDNDSYNWMTTQFDSSNASQGDSSDFVVRFDLVQNT